MGLWVEPQTLKKKVAYFVECGKCAKINVNVFIISNSTCSLLE
jgi:hypothetical protein